MDIDAYALARQRDWDRLGELARSPRLSGAASDELISRYQATATDLSALHTAFGQTVEGRYLSVTMSRARMRFTRVPANFWSSCAAFFAYQLPAALYRVRWWTLAAAIFTIVVATLGYLWYALNPGLVAMMATQSQIEQYAEHDFIDYYSEYSETTFGARVFTNNAWIAAQAIVGGITGVWPIYMLVQNAMGLGQSAALLGSVGHLDVFFLWIAPHGLLELTMIFVAAGTGFSMFWAWVVPGARTRVEALANTGRTLVMVAVATTMFLALSGFIEGFITRRDWPWALKIGIGALALCVFLAYAYVLGRRAEHSGRGGGRAFELGYERIVAD